MEIKMASCEIIHISIKNDSHLGIRLFPHIQQLCNILVNYNTSLIIFQNVMVDVFHERLIGALYSKEKNSLSSYILIECSITWTNSQIV